ncbi:hypothetical protein [Cetobacterium sp. SF1]|uniref:hypothetical protein n=1 Tax=unclassified Cetobacterium TaxID=2630983 RepID=UPI003CFBAD6B
MKFPIAMLNKLLTRVQNNSDTLNKINLTTEEIKQLIHSEIDKCSKELSKQLTKDIVNELLIENIQPLNKEINNLKNEIHEIQQRGEEMNKKLICENNELLNHVKDIKASQENMLKIMETHFQEKSKLNKIEKEYSNQQIELNKYKEGFKSIEKLIFTIDEIDSIKTSFYKKFKLIEGDNTNNIIKIALKTQTEVIKASLMQLRDIKIETKEKITPEEVSFYKAINQFAGKEMILVDRLNDREIDAQYWKVDENTRYFAKKIFPPINTGNDILRGVAKGEY